MTAFSALQAQVILNCSNLPPQHPHYQFVGQYVNEAKDEIMRLAATARGKKLLDYMPRMRNWRWVDVTVSGQDYLPLPGNMLALESVTITKSTAAFVLGATTEYPVFIEDDPVLFGLYPKTQTGWPVKFRRAASRVEFWPTPSSAFLTRVILRGTRAEDDLVNASDEPLMDQFLQNLLVKLATVITKEHAEWEDAAARRAEFNTLIGQYISIEEEERARSTARTRIAGTPR